ncbi:transcription factor TFIIIC subunit TFC1 CYBJADRAFT_14206 [Cyberlindnera jadinii NRRL Y-1542]|uniref:Transcription factor IIIC subunit 5 HTH domain-containing protein n=1 Tax=Cyberlindnera jadinii (strain ATCC 18201 / CBS 1600 / BCRC 20928 / JCM 3617 / NBRC 0987 / NRRL Y-1542) TaxID=983966 RepID=A0A1E4SAM1_CYBJN|nr:hypothetical protein CYBJADRAFT_14206 [Cyberlindnera jadinii NRRL Y-1542]ODV76551.1 hypothetical protein CYBJADRAFT_14206 [Cyberlindnera jadinii NRRL Y-1542]
MSKQYAKEHSLDIPHVSCIEFPLKVQNVDKAIGLVGGESAIIKACQDDSSHPLELRFTNNIYEHPVNAKVNTHEQILIKISLPKSVLKANAGNVQRSLQQLHSVHSKPIHITPVAIINKTFRFREMSDFQYQMSNSPFAQKVNKSIHSLNYTEICSLGLDEDLKPWAPNENGLYDLPPPPRFSSIPLPFNYHYKKNAATVLKEGKLTTRNKHLKLNSSIIKWEDQPPTGPSEESKQQLEFFQSHSDNLVYKDVLDALEIIRKLFEIRPIWIRKHLEANLPVHLKTCFKYALPQVSYTYTKGPWRQTYIRFGVDPKSSAEFSRYQTEGFRVPGFNKTVPKGFVSEVPNGVSKIFKFTGVELPHSLHFQLEDIVDEQVCLLLSHAKLRTECDFHDGWYDSTTMARLRKLMRYKLRCLMDGTTMDPEKVDYFINKLEVTEREGDADEDHDDADDDDQCDDLHLGDEEGEEDGEIDVGESNFEDIINYLEKHNPRGASEIAHLTCLLRQGNIPEFS